MKRRRWDNFGEGEVMEGSGDRACLSLQIMRNSIRKENRFSPAPHRKSIFRYNLWQKNKTKQIYMQVDVGPLMFGICTMPSRILLGRLSQLLSFLSTKFKFKILFN